MQEYLVFQEFKVKQVFKDQRVTGNTYRFTYKYYNIQYKILTFIDIIYKCAIFSYYKMINYNYYLVLIIDIALLVIEIIKHNNKQLLHSPKQHKTVYLTIEVLSIILKIYYVYI